MDCQRLEPSRSRGSMLSPRVSPSSRSSIKVASKISMIEWSRPRTTCMVAKKISLKIRVSTTPADEKLPKKQLRASLEPKRSLAPGNTANSNCRLQLGDRLSSRPSKGNPKVSGIFTCKGILENSATAMALNPEGRPRDSFGLVAVSDRPTLKSNLATLKFSLTGQSGRRKPNFFVKPVAHAGDSAPETRGLFRTSSRILEYYAAGPNELTGKQSANIGVGLETKQNLESWVKSKLQEKSDRNLISLSNLPMNYSNSFLFSKKSNGNLKYLAPKQSLVDECQSKHLDNESLDSAGSFKYESSKQLEKYSRNMGDRFLMKLPPKNKSQMPPASEKTILTFSANKNKQSNNDLGHSKERERTKLSIVSLRKLGYTNCSRWIDHGLDSEGIIQQFKNIL